MIFKTNFLIQIIFKKRLGFGSGLDSRVGLVSEVVLGLGLGLALELDLGSGFLRQRIYLKFSEKIREQLVGKFWLKFVWKLFVLKKFVLKIAWKLF